ncbi:MAG: hypothetical protein U0326_12570 [Polyangiales bacterium]
MKRLDERTKARENVVSNALGDIHQHGDADARITNDRSRTSERNQERQRRDDTKRGPQQQLTDGQIGARTG